MRRFVLAVPLALIACGRREPEATSARQLEPLASAPAVELTPTNSTDRYVVYARGDWLWAVVPDGSPEISLRIGNGPQTPTISPDGRTLAHRDDGELRLTTLPSLETVGIAGLSGPLFIGPWSPSGRLLFVVSEQGGPFELRTTHVVDVVEGTATVMEPDHIPQWGFDDDHVMLWHAFDGSGGMAWATVPGLEPYVRVRGLPHRTARTIEDARAGYLVGRSPGKIWVFEAGETLDEPGKSQTLLAVTNPRSVGDMRLAPDGRHVGLCVAQPTDPEFELPGELVVVSTEGGEPTALTECGRSWSLYWYDDRHIVLGGDGAVYWVGIDRELRVIADNAQLMPEGRHGSWQ